MAIQPLSSDRLVDFISYCKTFGREHDESYISDEDLSPDTFEIGEDEPAYILLSDANQLIGAASLMLEDYRHNRTGRFRIFHVLSQKADEYQLLLKAILSHCSNLDWVYLFLPENRHDARNAFEQAGFTIQRYSWLMQRPHREVGDFTFPVGFHLHPFDVTRDVEAWCDVRNAGFKDLLGQMDIFPEQVVRMVEEQGYFKEGMLILCNDEEPVGTVRVTEEVNDNNKRIGFIGGLAIVPKYQHQGLGRKLLRAAIQAGYRNGLETTELVVNSENERAAALYLDEGFEKKQTMICYQYIIES